MSKGGRTSTTWTQSIWRSGETKTIRVPIALADQIMEYAKAIDSGIAVSQGNTAQAILNAIDSYTKIRRKGYRPNQHSKKPDITSRTWNEMRKFQKLVQENPQTLGIYDTCE